MAIESIAPAPVCGLLVMTLTVVKDDDVRSKCGRAFSALA